MQPGPPYNIPIYSRFLDQIIDPVWGLRMDAVEAAAADRGARVIYTGLDEWHLEFWDARLAMEFVLRYA